jgi:peptidoglycan-associated lipoprotein
MKKITIVFVVMLGLLAFGCSTKVATKPEEGMEESAMQEQAMEPVEEVTMEPQTEVTGQEMARIEEEMVPKSGKPDLRDIYFDFDRYDLKDAARPVLREMATWLMDSDATALIEGHCDDRGTNEYNLALGDRRASSVKSFLISSGVPARKIETVSFGEEKPVCSEQTEDCWAQNRRAHFAISESGRLGAAAH